MSHYNHKVSHLFTAACLLASPAFIHAEESATTESGSLEAIAETPFRTRDDYTGSTMVIYPSVLNETRVAKGNFSALRFYIAPLCVIIIPDKFKTFTGRTSNEVMYSFEMLNFHPQMELQAKQYVTEQLQSSTDSKFKATGGNISRLTHQQVTFKLPDFPAIKIDPIGTVFEDRSLNDTLKLNMYVPINDKARFEEMVQAGSVNMDVKIYYIGKNVKIASMSWSAAELKNTEAYKKIDSSGAQFVNAQQLDDMVRETVQRKDITIFQDPGIPEQLTAKVQNMFDKFLNIQGEDVLFIKNQDEARQIEKEILAGTGLTAEEFKPIVTMWEITEQLKDETDYKKANQRMQEYMKDKSERSKIATDIHMNTSLSANAYVAKVSSSMSANFSYENEKTKHDVDKGYFASQDAFNEFRSKHHTEHGMEPRITPRGLNLVETKKFKDNLSMTASAVAYYPVDKTRQLGITGAFVDLDKLQQYPLTGVLTIETIKENYLAGPNNYVPFPVGKVISNTLLKESPSDSKIIIPTSGNYIAITTVNVCIGGSYEYVESFVFFNGEQIVNATGRAQECGSATATAFVYAKKGDTIFGACSINQGGIGGTCRFSLALMK